MNKKGTGAEFETQPFRSQSTLDRIRGLSPVCSLLLIFSAALAAQSPVAQSGGTVWDGTYSAAQAARGKANFTTSCERCHLADLSGGTGPSLKGTRFMTDWENESLY